MKMIPVFYSPAMCADSLSFSPSPAKPAAVVDAWSKLDIPISVIEPIPLHRREIYRAHDEGYVDDVLAGQRNNGFGNRSRSIAATLRHTNGSMLEAVRRALFNGIGAVSPSSGFHHAHHARGCGFCTFNGLMIAALALSPTMRVGILDCDHHYGDGTDDIIKQVGVKNIEHVSLGGCPYKAEDYLDYLARRMLDLSRCDIVLYQAGADSHKDDPLGGHLTTEQLFERDRIVFEQLRERNIPVAWNLAGGYQKDFSKVIEIHTNTMKAFAESFFKEV